MDTNYAPRPHQQSILRYRRGLMGVSAVPGSGKTWTLSRLAADLLIEGRLADDQEILVVTLVNSAVDNFSRQVGEFLQAANLLPNLGYMVRTLHGLAHDIVRERPDLVGLGDSFQIIDEREAGFILDEISNSWLRTHPDGLEQYLSPDLSEDKRLQIRRQTLPYLVREIAVGVIRTAKDRRLSPERLRSRLDQLPLPLPLAELGAALYEDYQRALMYRAAVDFDDLIRFALDALENDPSLLEHLRHRWPYILEDEAQDSSRLQEEILRTLSGPHGNWVRVGDPNQAIYETFTTANPRYLLTFLQQPDVSGRDLPSSGRSTPTIISLANRLIEWTRVDHPHPQVRNALSPPLIEPVPPDQYGANPPDELSRVHIMLGSNYTPQGEIQAVARSLGAWLDANPNSTVAALAPRNMRANELIEELSRLQIPLHDSLLKSSIETRSSAGALGNLLNYLTDPGSAARLATAYKVWRRGEVDADRKLLHKQTEKLIRGCRKVEDYLWPGPELDWLAGLSESGADPACLDELGSFRELVRRWQGAVILPIDQLILTLSQDIFSSPTDLAIAHKLAVLLRRAESIHPNWRLPEMTNEIGVIAKNERRFLGFGRADTGFEPDKYPGKVIVATMHKAKGLEFDRVHLLSVNNYNFPSGAEYDSYIAEKWYLRDSLNLPVEALAQLEAAFSTDEYAWYQEGQATQSARLEYIRERLRLLYVGITRARRELVITWNTGRRGEIQAAKALAPLYELAHPPQEDQV